jgi:hypothetical protein
LQTLLALFYENKRLGMERASPRLPSKFRKQESNLQIENKRTGRSVTRDARLPIAKKSESIHHYPTKD